MDKLAADFVDHCSTRWQAKLAQVEALIPVKEAALAATTDPDVRERLARDIESLHGQAQWMESTIVEIVISEAQNEVRDFRKWGFDIIPHRMVMKLSLIHISEPTRPY